MKRKTTRFFLCFMLIVLSLPGIVTAAPEQRIALVIGNSAYSSGPLKNPVNDATDMAATLKKLGFNVILKKNANLETMEEAIEDFGNRLKRGGVGLFYYAGHGVQVNGVNYLIPIGAKINKEADVRFKSCDAGRILAEMENANNGLNIVLLDACRDNPFGKSFRSASRGLAIVSNAPTGTFISYSTSPGQVARDGDGRNSPYTKALLQFIQEPGVPIGNVFMKVRQKLRKNTGQVPWELSSLEGDFYFVPVKGKAVTGSEESSVSTTAATDDLDENRKIKSVQQLVEDEKKKVKKKATPVEFKKKFEEKKAQVRTAADELNKLKLQIQLGWDNKENMKQKESEYQQKFEAYKKLVKDSNDELDIMESNLDAGKEVQHQAEVERNGATLAMSKPPAAPSVTETGRDGRFITYYNGMVMDTRTNLMWAPQDNGSDIDWFNAKKYCDNYRGGGYVDWRLPTLDELASLYDAAKTYKPDCGHNVHLTGLIRLTCDWVWASETRGNDAANFLFSSGKRGWNYQGYGVRYRALLVRSGK